MSDRRQRSTISEHDQAVLGRIFNPETPYFQDEENDEYNSTTPDVTQCRLFLFLYVFFYLFVLFILS